MNLGVVVPNYNGAELLPQYLPTIMEAAKQAGVPRVLVVDDCSTDSSVAVARQVAPQAEVIVREANGGFGEAVNTGALALDTDLMAVCMTDIEVQPDALTLAAERMEEQDIFAVGLHLKESDDGGNAGITGLPFKRAFFHTEFPASTDAERFGNGPVNIAFAVGGAMVVRKKMFDALQGFDPLYAPYFWEDIDICWRAWKRGWRSVNEPAAIAWHRHPHVTVTSNADGDRVGFVFWRNRISFVRKNIHDPLIRLQHSFWTKVMLAKRRACGDEAFCSAVRAVPAAMRNVRRNGTDATVYTDRQLIRYLARPRMPGEKV